MKPKTLLSIFLSMTLLTLSCSKELDTQKENTVIKMTDEKLVKKVESFIQLAKDVKEGKILKSEDKMPIPDAINSIDESFNYQYVFHTEPYGDILTVSTEVILPIIVGENKTYSVDAAAGYNNAVSQVKTKYVSIQNTDKKLIGLIVKNLGVYNTSNIKLRITAQIGIGKPAEGENYDDWFWIRDSRNCEGTVGQIGAPNIIQQRVIFSWLTAPPPNTRIWFTNSDSLLFDDPKANANPYDPTGIDNYCDYCLYYATDRYNITEIEECIEGTEDIINQNPPPTEMSLYLRGASYLIDNFLYSTPYSFQNVKFDSRVGTDGPSHGTIQHKMNLTFGVKHSSQWYTQYPICIDLNQ